jgi:hypothetical protein
MAEDSAASTTAIAELERMAQQLRESMTAPESERLKH